MTKFSGQSDDEVIIHSTIVGSAEGSLSNQSNKKAVIVVDPLSSGAVLAQMLMERHYSVIRVLSTHFPEDVLKLLPASCKDLVFAASIQHEGDTDATVRKLKSLGLNIVHITVGCESVSKLPHHPQLSNLGSMLANHTPPFLFSP